MDDKGNQFFAIGACAIVMLETRVWFGGGIGFGFDNRKEMKESKQKDIIDSHAFLDQEQVGNTRKTF